MLARWVQAIIDAYAQDARNPIWTTARHFRGADGMDDGIGPSLCAEVNRRVGEENLLDLLRKGALLEVSSAGVHGEQGEWRREERASLMCCTTDTCGGEEVSGLKELDWLKNGEGRRQGRWRKCFCFGRKKKVGEERRYFPCACEDDVKS